MRVKDVIDCFDDETGHFATEFSALELKRIQGSHSIAEEEALLEAIFMAAYNKILSPWKSRSIIAVILTIILIGSTYIIHNTLNPSFSIVIFLLTLVVISTLLAAFATIRLTSLQTHLDQWCEQVRMALGGGSTILDVANFPDLDLP